MDINNLILEFLKEHNHVIVPSFGEFYVKNAKAVLDSEQKSILPPGKKIAFSQDTSFHDDALISYISEKEGISKFEAELELKKMTNTFIIKIKNNGRFDLENLGSFIKKDTKIEFVGNRIFSDHSDFYGLEQIDLEDLNIKRPIAEQSNPVDSTEDYKFNNSILWIFLLLIPVLGILFLGITQSERIFGKKSFNDLSVQNATHRMEQKKARKDTLKNSKTLDSTIKTSQNFQKK